ncbi:hypothetical protein [Corynebacterium terpenotabidum]|uniref:Uncharacterized protein n=1 Tax=Corynebacterium terpenotabidum Y-11 TaxID=1200352 RepID=S4XB98_9CORY|nr:hypothetical protein [Corynebacterium terpenotabidum]AGP29876.1 hypothetical protein A606_01105 [Corynebacterium terpenotabidum Y-11]
MIGPQRSEVEAVAAALQQRSPGRRVIVGAGPDTADRVIAVAGGTDGDAVIVRAVRDAMGGCVLYTGEETDLAAEPGVTVVRWGSAVSAAPDLDRLASAVDAVTVDLPRWVSDARRSDADRIDRVRIAVRLSAEKHATDLLGAPAGYTPVGYGDPATATGRTRLDTLFRARLRCTVLEQGVEWPHLPDHVEPEEVPEPAGEDADRHRALLLVAASVGAGLAAAVGVSRAAGPAVGLVAGVVVAALLALVRWRMLAGARRERARVRGVARLRREWTAVVTEVVARLRIPPVVDALTAEVGR